jgi:hypothetical protein
LLGEGAGGAQIGEPRKLRGCEIGHGRGG